MDTVDSIIFGPLAIDKLKRSLNDFVSGLDEEEKGAFSVLVDQIKKQPRQEIKHLSEEDILTSDEIKQYLELVATKNLISSNPCNESMVAIMKATRLCNLRCVYCHSWRTGKNQVMPFATLGRAIRDIQLGQGTKNIVYVWHGGETTLVPIEYYKKAIWLQEKFKVAGQKIWNVIQTNGTRLDDKWINFLKDYDFGVGVSLDGPPEVNDKRRLDKKGRATTHKVVDGIKELNKAKIKYGVLVVVDEEIISLGPKRLLEYLSEIGVTAVGLLNAIPENDFSQGVKGDYIPIDSYVSYLRQIFKVWWEEYRDKIVIREIAELVEGVHKKKSPKSCYYNGNCMGKYLTIEPNGDLWACEKYIGDQAFLYGNLFKYNGIGEMLASSQKFNAAWQITEDSDKKMKNCE